MLFESGTCVILREPEAYLAEAIMREAGERLAPISKTLTEAEKRLEKSGANAITK